MDKRSILFIICIGLTFFAIQYWFQKDASIPKSLPPPPPKVEEVAPISQPSALIRQDGTFYVLENEYQQLVFSSQNGSIAEINLPLESRQDTKSLVKEIDADRLIVKEMPRNAHFPLEQAEYPDGSSKNSKVGGYYPLLRRSLYNKNGSLFFQQNPLYYATNIVTSASTQNSSFRVSRFDANTIQFEGTVQGARITKTYTIPAKKNGPYCFDLTIDIDGDANDLWITSGIPDVEMISNSFSPLLRYQVLHGNESDVETISLSAKNPVTQLNSISPHWISNSNGFLGVILDPTSEIRPGFRATYIDGKDTPTRLGLLDPALSSYPFEKYPGYTTALPLKSGSQTFRIFSGPYDDRLLKDLDKLYAEPERNYNPDYTNAQSIQGWFSFISRPFTTLLYFLLRLFYAITHSWGFSIILLTVALRAMMYPLNNWSIKSTVRMQEIAPRVKAIQDRYKKDPKRAQTEVMAFYKEQGVNPFSGCIPMLLQMPFLIGMFYLLKSSFPLRGASFIPGWIDNLAAPDVVFDWGYPLFLIGSEFHLLPIFLGITMFLQQKMSAAKTPVGQELSESQKQQKMMANFMSIIFTVMFYNFPSGLNLYFLSSTLLGIGQQWYIMKRMALPKQP